MAVREDFEDVIREESERGEQSRRLLISVLVVTCIALAISNVVMARWMISSPARASVQAPARPAGEPSTRVAAAAEPPPPSASIRSRDDSPSSVTVPKMAEPTPAEPRAASPPLERTARPETPSNEVVRAPTPRGDAPNDDESRAEALRPEAPPPGEPASSALDLPPRTAVLSPAAPRTSANAAPPSARSVSTPPAEPTSAAREEATAAWMLSTYGRRDAEARARAALQFYDARSADGRYWRRVLGLITAAR